MKHKEEIQVRGAREHNLKNISVNIPRGKTTVVTGLSGSGKSSLVFDTVYAEGQRRYIEGLSSYARSFLEQLKKPDVDSISGLSPAISIEQKTSSTNPRSTVGTVTEAYDYLRLLFAKVGKPECPKCKKIFQPKSTEQIVDEISAFKKGTKLLIMAPVASYKKGEFKKEFPLWEKMGFANIILNGEEMHIADRPSLKKTIAHNIDLIADKIIMKDDIRHRISTAVEKSVKAAEGRVKVVDLSTDETHNYSCLSSCPTCNFSIPELDPLLFSFNSPKGACPDCNGIGSLTYSYGDENEDGEEEEFYSEEDCGACEGTRLRKEALYVKVGGKDIHHYSKISIKELLAEVKTFRFSNRERLITDKILEMLSHRLQYLDNVGASYLSLGRSARTLSGGESQRIKLASQIGSGLRGVLYVLDEPSIGLHPKDHKKLLKILKEIQDKGNTILLVEHDEETILNADLVIDMGPGAGVKGGSVLDQGSPEHIKKSKSSITGPYLAKTKEVFVREKRRSIEPKRKVDLLGAKGNNLKNVDVSFYLDTFTAVTGVSGSGKSSLIIDTLYKALMNHFHKSGLNVLPFKGLKGLDLIDSVVNITQKPIGRTPRSNPATYTGLFSLIRNLFVETPEAKIRGFKPGYFSFNVKGGRCEHCSGAGSKKVEMNFLANVHVDCDYCQGKRYNPECLSLKYKDKSIADVLAMSVAEALEFFAHHKAIRTKLETLDRVGLDYISLGQSSTTLSGGEAQRIKLSKELSKRPQGHTLYILDEPTTGLHFQDISKLIGLLHELVDQGNTVIVIEHNLDLIQSADYVIELGPEGGPDGGELVNASLYSEFVKNKKSPTALYMKELGK